MRIGRLLLTVGILSLCVAGASVAFAGVTVETTAAFSSKDLVIKEIGDYHGILLPSGGSLSEVGKPMLPAQRVWVAIPAGQVAEGVTVLSQVATELPGAYRVFPLQPPRKISDPEVPDDVAFVQPDAGVYSSDRPYPSVLARLVGQADLAGQQLAAVELHPLQWIPSTGKLTFYEEIRLALECVPGDPPTERLHKMSPQRRQMYQETMEKMVLNPQDVDVPLPTGPASKSLPARNYDHVIITDSSWAYFFQPLVHWHVKRGLQDTVVSRQWIYANYSGDNTTKIRDFIQDARSTWGANWFLLGGDVDVIPIAYKTLHEESVPGDHYYADYDDDWVCEVSVGRAPVGNTSQINTFVNKVLKYERDPPLTDYALDILLMGMDLDGGGVTPTEDMKEYIDNHYIPSRFDVTKVYDSHTGIHPDSVIAALNAGQNLFNHSDHSWWTVMGCGDRNHGWYIDRDDVDALSNTDRTCIVYSTGCHPAQVDEDDCIGEHFVVYNANQAGVAFTGNTRSGFYYYGDPYSLSSFLDMEWWRSLFNYNKYRLGETLNDSRNRNYPTGESWRYLHYGLILLGEPEMPIWTDTPAVPDVSHPDIFTTGSLEFSVHVEVDGEDVDQALVCLWKEDEVYLTDYTDVNGDVTFNPFPASVGTMWVTVTKQNVLPYEGEAEIILFSPPDPAWTDEGDQEWVMYGYSLAGCGDVNGDGYGDVVVGAPLYSNGQEYEGRAFLYQGSASGLSVGPSWTAENDSAYTYFGISVAWAGDVNGDGYSDILAGAQTYSSGESDEGAAYLYLGGVAGPSEAPDWMAEGDSAGANFGFCVSGAGDVNGDGYSDVIVGAPYYTNTYKGRACLYLGGPSGLSSTPDWAMEGDQAEAHFGSCVSAAGDVDGDGYGDVLVGADFYNDEELDEGQVNLYLGGPSGLSSIPAWTATGGDDHAHFGRSISSAGDVNGDGYCDVLIGAPGHTVSEAGEGRAYLFLGGPGGLSTTADWTMEGGQPGAEYGYSVSSAGDVNGDGYCDVVIGAESYEADQTDEGCVFLYLGNAFSPYLILAWRAERDQAEAYFGNCVADAGDVDGDGYGDIIAAAYLYDNGQEDEGQAYLFAGDEGPGMPPYRPRQAQSGGASLIGPLGQSDSQTEFRLQVTGWYPGGSDSVKLQWEVKPLGTNFDSTALGESASWALADSATGVELDERITGLIQSTPYHWRARVLYHPDNPGGLDHSMWLSPSHNGWNETDFRTAGSGGNPPSPVDDLAATLSDGAKSSSGDVLLSWTEPYSEAGVSYYVVYRSTEPSEMGDSLAGTDQTEYRDVGVVGDPGTNHYYSIKAVDVLGRKSAFSNQVGEFDLQLFLPEKSTYEGNLSRRE